MKPVEQERWVVILCLIVQHMDALKLQGTHSRLSQQLIGKTVLEPRCSAHVPPIQGFCFDSVLLLIMDVDRGQQATVNRHTVPHDWLRSLQRSR